MQDQEPETVPQKFIFLKINIMIAIVYKEGGSNHIKNFESRKIEYHEISKSSINTTIFTM